MLRGPRSSLILLLISPVVSGFASPAHAARVEGVYPFVDTGTSSSNYGKGDTPYAELLEASDGNFYGTTVYGGSGLCPNYAEGGYTGCGTIFRITAQGAETVLYSFPFDTSTTTAPNGAFPTAGLIEGKDGYLYGVAQDGGIRGCNGEFGCGTLFRISSAGAFTLLHQFCGGGGCDGISEGGRPMNHLVQTADGTLYGTAAEGGYSNDGTLFAASTAGAITTLHYFEYGAGDGDDPFAALLIGQDGKTLYGTTVFGGANGGGIVFSYGAGGLNIIHSFDNTQTGVAYEPNGALIYGPDGLLYGTTTPGSNGGTLFSLTTSGGSFAIDATFPSGNPQTGLLLGSDGKMYGTLLSSDVSSDGSTYVYNPTTKVMTAQVGFTTATGAAPRGVLIEGRDKYLYGTNSLYGGSNRRGVDGGTLYRIGPPLTK
jgi:uncharacterized repeat protein (TIGR03803 family)